MKKLILISLFCVFYVEAYCQWSITGNAGTNPSINFIGTTDNKNFKIRTNNNVRVNITNSGKIGIGDFSPVFKLDVKGGSINTDSLYRIGGNVVLSLGAGKSTFVGITNNTSNTGSENTFIGSGAGSSNTSGLQNTGAGANALHSNTSGGNNTAFGMEALKTNTLGSSNTALGGSALFQNSTGGNNTALGLNSLRFNSTGNNNTSTGVTSLFGNSTGNQNTAAGVSSLRFNSTGSDNTAIGFQALFANDGGNGNVAIGINTLATSVQNSFNIAIGDSALFRYNHGSSIDNLVAIGHVSLSHNTTGVFNTAIGGFSLYSNTTGSSNTAIGANALLLNATGNRNTATGADALHTNSSGVNNTATGVNALFSNTSGNNNAAYGRNTLLSNVTGINNCAFGTEALSSNTTGNNNCAQGINSLFLNSTGSNNTAIGNYALRSNSTGNNNTAIGDSANVASGNLTNATAIGANAFATLSNTIVLGSIAGVNGATGGINVGIGTNTPSFKIAVFNGTTTGTYTTTGWAHSSDARLKTNVKPIEHALDKILKLQGVSYNWKQTPTVDNQVGFIAQEVEKIFPEVVVKDRDGNYAMVYQNLTAPIVEAIKEQHDEILLKNEILENQQAQINELNNKLDVVLKQMKKYEYELSLCCQTLNPGINRPANEVNTDSREPKLEQNVPNPFSEKATIKFFIPDQYVNCKIKIYSAEGFEIFNLPVSARGAGQIEIPGQSFAAGTYTYTLIIDGKAWDSKQFIITR